MEVLRRSETLNIQLEYEPEAGHSYRVFADGVLAYATNVDTSALSEYADLAAEGDWLFAERRTGGRSS